MISNFSPLALRPGLLRNAVVGGVMLRHKAESLTESGNPAALKVVG